jgi:hypothetical protein
MSLPPPSGSAVRSSWRLPTLRALSPEAPTVVARAFQRVAWPAFGVLVGTGVWNIVAVRSELHGSHLVILDVKLVVVVLSGLAAALHTRARSTAGKAVLGSATGLFALLALLLGLQLAL